MKALTDRMLMSCLLGAKYWAGCRDTTVNDGHRISPEGAYRPGDATRGRELTFTTIAGKTPALLRKVS